MQLVCKNEGMHFADGLQNPQRPGGAVKHNVALYLGKCPVRQVMDQYKNNLFPTIITRDTVNESGWHTRRQKQNIVN